MTTLAYFGALGLAFMIVEIPTMQMLTVYLGRPVYSLAVVLFSLLLFSGLGSWWSGRWATERIVANMRTIFPALIVALAIHTVFSSAILARTLQFGLAARLGVAILLLSVLGFMMGIPFPVGIRRAGRFKPSTVPWLWGINGITSVLGSATATALSIHIGFRLTLVVAILLYAAAAGLFLAMARDTEPEGALLSPTAPEGPLPELV